MDAILRDIRYGFRSLIKSPGVTLFATLALTLGIGVTTTMFSIVYGALMKGLPYPEGSRIVEVNRNVATRNITRMDMPWVEYFDYREQQHSFAKMAGYTDGTMNVSGTDLPGAVRGRVGDDLVLRHHANAAAARARVHRRRGFPERREGRHHRLRHVAAPVRRRAHACSAR